MFSTTIWQDSGNSVFPFQFALSTRAGTDCVGHVIRALTDANPGPDSDFD